MNKPLVILFLLVSPLFVLAQESYLLKTDIPYYENPDDAYTKSRCKLDIYYPENSKNYPTIVWFHGGGLTAGNKYVPEGLKEKGLAVVTVNYRLSPNIKSPEFLRDAAKSVAWVMENIEKYGGSSKLIFLSGHSAGGYLASMVGLDKKWLGEWGKDPDDLAALIPFSGHAITHFTVRKEMGLTETQPLVDEMAPLFHVRRDAPPLLLITGDREMELLGRYEENAYMMRMMKIAGHTDTKLIELQGYGHNMEYPALPILLRYVKEIAKQPR